MKGWTAREDWEDAGLPDLYFSRAYCGLYRDGGARPLLFEYRDQGETFRLPMLERPVPADPPGAPAGLVDLQSPYGYGGPWSSTTDPGFLAAAMGALAECCDSRRVLAAFIRFHPLLDNHDRMPGFRVFSDRDTIWMDLSDGDILGNQISQKNRNMIRKAEKEGVTIAFDRGFERYADFRSIYSETMDALGADAFYRFDGKYFEALRLALGERAFLAHALLGNEVIASAILMRWGDLAHYHLSGARRSHRHLPATNLLLYRAAVGFREEGARKFHLGGGLSGDPEDGLYRFKRSFSPHASRFHLGGKVYLEREYSYIKALWAERYPERAAISQSKILFYRF